MGILYLVSTAILLTSFIILEKSEKKLDILGSIFISIIILFCYNAFLCYVLTFFAILNKLWILSLINLIISVLLLYITIKKRRIQKFKFDKLDIIFIVVSILIILIITFINFDFPFNVNYETSDPSVHYLTAVQFAESEILLPGIEEPDYIYGRLNQRRIVSYVNSGLLMKVLSTNLDPIECYNIFVSFGIFTLFLTGMAMYYTLKNFSKNKEHKILAMIVSLIYTLGYPLNSFLFGFEYLSMGILIICAIIDLIIYYDRKILNNRFLYIVLFLLNFGLFSSYYMFVPILYPAEWIYFCIKNYRENKKIVTKNLLKILTVTLLLPFILGYIYHFEADLYAIIINRTIDIDQLMKYPQYQINTGFAVDGYIYVNRYSNFILLLPLTIYYLIKEKKENRIFETLVLAFTILFIGILYIGYFNHRVSMYYLQKNYFVLWIILWYINFKALIKMSEDVNYLPRLLIGMYIMLMIIGMIISKVKITSIEQTNNKNRYENIFEVTQIFAANKNILKNQKIELNQEEIDLILYTRENLDYNSKIEVVADPTQYYWSYVILRYINDQDERYRNKGQYGLTEKVMHLEYNIDDADYIIYFNRSGSYEYLGDKIFENKEIIYENPAGGILKKVRDEN